MRTESWVLAKSHHIILSNICIQIHILNNVIHGLS
jgi:hypothetical protein